MKPKGLFLFLSMCLCANVFSFELAKKQTTYLDTPHLNLGFSLGSTKLVHGKGDIKGRYGYSFRISAGHSFTKSLEAELFYQVSWFKFNSPNPIASSEPLRTKAGITEEVIRLKYSLDKWKFQPYIAAGIGGYQFFGEDSETALSIPYQFQIPIALGLKNYYAKDRFSFDLEFMYRFLFGENQDANRLALLGVDKVSFNAISIMATFSFYTF